MYAEQQPRQVAVARICAGAAHHHRRPAGAAVGAGVGEEVTLALKAQSEGRGDRRLAHHRHVVQGVVKAEREAHDQQRAADLDLITGDAQAAFDRLIDLIRRTSGPERDQVRVRLLELFDTMDGADPVVKKARRALSMALF